MATTVVYERFQQRMPQSLLKVYCSQCGQLVLRTNCRTEGIHYACGKCGHSVALPGSRS